MRRVAHVQAGPSRMRLSPCGPTMKCSPSDLKLATSLPGLHLSQIPVNFLRSKPALMLCSVNLTRRVYKGHTLTRRLKAASFDALAMPHVGELHNMAESRMRMSDGTNKGHRAERWPLLRPNCSTAHRVLMLNTFASSWGAIMLPAASRAFVTSTPMLSILTLVSSTSKRTTNVFEDVHWRER